VAGHIIIAIDNTNRLIMQYWPRATDLSVHSDAKLGAIVRQLNERPRKTLQYQIPAAKFSGCVAATIRIHHPKPPSSSFSINGRNAPSSRSFDAARTFAANPNTSAVRSCERLYSSTDVIHGPIGLEFFYMPVRPSH
jgi:hypothetical protein